MVLVGVGAGAIQYAVPRGPRVNPMRIDLHTHSSHSDGTDPVEVLVRDAGAAGLDVIALTDHDTVGGWEEADRVGAEVGVTVVPGVEVSCRYRGVSLHLLGYLLDPQHRAFREEVTASREGRLSRARAMADLLIEAGYLDSFEEVLAQAGGQATTIGRPHLADALVARGHFPSRTEAFATVLAADGPFYVGHYAPGPVRAVEVLREARGVTVLAHPLARDRGHVVGDDAIAAMAEAGLHGIEVDHRDHAAADREHARALADRFGLFATGSSDYHGRLGKPNQLGEHTTEPAVLRQILELGTGSGLLGAPLPESFPR